MRRNEAGRHASDHVTAQAIGPSNQPKSTADRSYRPPRRPSRDARRRQLLRAMGVLLASAGGPA